MIKSITITNHLDESLTMDLKNPYNSGFIIRSIDGLGPVKANVNITDLVTSDGGIFNSARLESRNIVLSLAFLENPTIEDTRLKSYRFFPIKKYITFKIETDRRTCSIVGYVESNELDIFSDSEGCQISILCPDPYFKSIKNTIVLYGGIEPLFEFPFSNESLDEPLIELGNLKNNNEESIVYTGDEETGFTVKLHAIGGAKGITIYDTIKSKIMKINDDRLEELTGSSIIDGDDIIINSSVGEKSIILIRNGEKINILNVLERPIDWLTLIKGENIIGYTAAEGLSNLQFSIEYRILYEGV